VIVRVSVEQQVALGKELHQRKGAVAELALAEDGVVHGFARFQSRPVTSQPSCLV
jgi:hypothetical protein